MKKFYLLFVAVILAACSAEPVETEGITGLDANLEGKKIKSAVAQDPDVRREWTYSNNGGVNQGKVLISNNCDTVTLRFVELNGDPLDAVEFDIRTSLPSLNNGGNLDGSLPYGFTDLDENLSITVSLNQLGITHEDDLIIFAKAWGKWAGLSEHGKLNYFTYDVEEISCPTCEESFAYNPNDNGSYTFTYVPKEDLTGAELVFTFPQANADFTVEGWKKNGNGNAQTWKREMNLDACTTYQWTVKLTRICMGSTANNNVWTDFTVNGESKKGDLQNITQNCP